MAARITTIRTTTTIIPGEPPGPGEYAPMRFVKLLSLFGIAALSMALALSGAAQEKKGGKAAEKKAGARQAKAAGDAEKGAEVYKTNCAVCHFADKTTKRIGPGLAGLYKKEKLENEKPVNDDNVKAVILEGYGKMIPFKEKLDEKQVADLVAYLCTL